MSTEHDVIDEDALADAYKTWKRATVAVDEYGALYAVMLTAEAWLEATGATRAFWIEQMRERLADYKRAKSDYNNACAAFNARIKRSAASTEKRSEPVDEEVDSASYDEGGTEWL